MAQDKTADQPRLVVETITPERARELLDLNVDNRNIRKPTVAMYARDMKAGNWKLTGEAICVNGERLLNGQHRLSACIAADTPFETAVLYDADSDIHFAMDKGMKRTLADELRWRGEIDVNNLGAALNMLWRYEKGTIGKPEVVPSTSELVAFLGDNAGLRESVNQGLAMRRQVPALPVGATAATHYLILSRHGDELADTFAERVASGAGLVEGDPILVLRKYATNVSANRNFRPRREEWFAVLIKAANYWLMGRPLKALRWRRVGPLAEAFPSMIGPDELS